ncbi:MAG: DUF2281 domain-containing protein [Verrucomicrobiae bacterium]|nr:DUF2281 domain-containing protein [Verrucomicrobiae bacterium]
MSTVAEIEAAIKALPPEKVEELASWLNARRARPADETASHESLIGMWKGKIVLKPGWDEPLEDLKDYTE